MPRCRCLRQSAIAAAAKLPPPLLCCQADTAAAPPRSCCCRRCAVALPTAPLTPRCCYSLSFENEPTSSNSHSTRNKKWKLWVGGHASSCWLLCLCVLCFVFYAASKTIRCYRVSLYYLIFPKIRAGARSLLRPEKKVLVVCLAGCAVVSVFGSGRK